MDYIDITGCGVITMIAIMCIFYITTTVIDYLFPLEPELHYFYTTIKEIQTNCGCATYVVYVGWRTWKFWSNDEFRVYNKRNTSGYYVATLTKSTQQVEWNNPKYIINTLEEAQKIAYEAKLEIYSRCKDKWCKKVKSVKTLWV